MSDPCFAVFLSACTGGGGAAAASGGGDADDGEPQEEKTQVQRDERYTVLFGKTAILNMSVKNAAGKWDWQNRGKGQMSVRKDTQTGKYYITFNLDGVSHRGATGQAADCGDWGWMRLHLCQWVLHAMHNNSGANACTGMPSLHPHIAL